MNQKERRRTIRNSVREARALMNSCSLCPRRCHVNRLKREVGYCGAPYPAKVFYHNVLYGEEMEISPTYEIFFTGCNINCSFCYLWDKVHSTVHDESQELPPLQEKIKQAAKSCRSISLIGGEPTVNLLSIMEFLKETDPLPLLVWNTNMYMDRVVPSLLSNIIDLYIADLHFYRQSCSQLIGGADDYFQHASEALLHAAQYTKVIIRHLLLPNHIECCFFPLADWLKKHLPDTPVRIMENFYNNDSSLKAEEIHAAKEYAAGIGLNLYNEMNNNETPHDIQLTAPSEMRNEEIIIERDGKILIQHLTKDFLDIATLLEPDNKNFRKRKKVFLHGEV